MVFVQMIRVVALCSYPGYDFTVERDSRGEIFLQAGYWEPDTGSTIASSLCLVRILM